MVTLSARSLSNKASTTDCALFETGNIRPWSSSFSSIPRFSKNEIISSLLNSENALYRKRPFPGICLMISSTGRRLVTLQRPPPEMASFLPSLFPLSINRTDAPCSADAIAAISPEGPPPMTMTS